MRRHDFLTVAARRNARASIVRHRGGARHRAALCAVARRPRDPRRHVAHDTCAFNTCVRFGRSTLAINFRLVARARRFATAWLRGAQRFKGRVSNVGNFARALILSARARVCAYSRARVQAARSIDGWQISAARPAASVQSGPVQMYEWLGPCSTARPAPHALRR